MYRLLFYKNSDCKFGAETHTPLIAIPMQALGYTVPIIPIRSQTQLKKIHNFPSKETFLTYTTDNKIITTLILQTNAALLNKEENFLSPTHFITEIQLAKKDINIRNAEAFKDTPDLNYLLPCGFKDVVFEISTNRYWYYCYQFISISGLLGSIVFGLYAALNQWFLYVILAKIYFIIIYQARAAYLRTHFWQIQVNEARMCVKTLSGNIIIPPILCDNIVFVQLLEQTTTLVIGYYPRRSDNRVSNLYVCYISLKSLGGDKQQRGALGKKIMRYFNTRIFFNRLAAGKVDLLSYR